MNKIFNRLFVLLVLLSGMPVIAVCGHPFDPHVVLVRQDAPDGEQGAGFVIAREKNEVLVITAAHVVKSPGKVSVTFFGDARLYSGEVTEHNDFFDIALIRVRCDTLSWSAYPMVDNAASGDPIFIISVRQNRSLLPATGNGVIIDRQVNEMVLRCPGIERGDSGSPVWSTEGLIGMVTTRSPVQAVSAGLIKKIVTEDWRQPWELRNISATRKLPATTPPPDMNAEITFPYTAAINGQNRPGTAAINDGDKTTSYTFSAEGWHSMTFVLEKPVSFRKMKFYIPFGVHQDILTGFIAIPGLNVKEKISRVVLDVMEKEGNGVWYTFDLKHYYLTNYVSLTFKVKKPTPQVPTTINIYEIKLLGLQP